MRIVFRLVTRWSSALLQENSPCRRGHSQGCVSSKSSSFYARLASSLYLAKVFFGGGTGITPLMSMLREAAHDPATPVIFQGSHQLHVQSSNCILFTSTRLSWSTEPPTHLPTPSIRSCVTLSSPTSTSPVQVTWDIALHFHLWNLDKCC